jgi:hypothetical protein
MAPGRPYPIAFLPLFEEMPMVAFWLLLIVAVVVIVGSALILLRTARKPKLPGSIKPKPYGDDDEGGW